VSTPNLSESTNHQLDPIFFPRGVAVVGASRDNRGARGPGGWLQSLKDAGQPNIYPVNPRADAIEGLPAYARLTDIPGPVDHVISAIPAAHVLEMLEDASAKGVRSIHLFTAGFAETGIADRLELQRQLKARASELGIRLIGPNCLGLYVPHGRVSFAQQLPTESGPVAFFSQSGTNASDAAYNGALRGLRFSKVVSFGNAIDVSAAELIDYARHDSETEIIGAYIEGMTDARDFFRSLRSAAQLKPVGLLKGGLLPSGGRATQSHTASLAGSGQIWAAAARQTNAVLVHNMHEMVDLLVGWRFGALPAGPRIGLVVGGGGISVQGADDVEREGLQLPPLAEHTLKRLAEVTPVAGTGIRNPVDTMSLWDGEKIRPTLDAVAEDPSIDAVIVQVGMNWGLGFFGNDQLDARRNMIGEIAEARKRHGIAISMVVPISVDHRHGQSNATLSRMISDAGLPLYYSICDAARAMKRLLTWNTRRAERVQP
jgi:acyl-CoA synthetase (NDP forming)